MSAENPADELVALSNQELRANLAEVIRSGTARWSPTVFVVDEAIDIADALMPVVKRALAATWDAALEDAWQSEYDRDRFAPNPWQGARNDK